MKKTVLALALAALSTTAFADLSLGSGFTLTGDSTTPIVASTGDDGWGPIYDFTYSTGTNLGASLPGGYYTTATLGTLVADAASTFKVTFLGRQAINLVFYTGNGVDAFDNQPNASPIAPGTTYSFDTAAGAINFGFLDTSDNVRATNGGANSNQISYFANTAGLKDANGNPFAFLIGYNDDATINGDYDDMVLGVSAVPVPAALPLMGSALGMFGVARRRSKFA